MNKGGYATLHVLVLRPLNMCHWAGGALILVMLEVMFLVNRWVRFPLSSLLLLTFPYEHACVGLDSEGNNDSVG